MKKSKYFRNLLVIGLVWGAVTLGCLLLPARGESQSERRKLAQFPAMSVAQITSGKFMSEFESYTLDQFPFRDQFRKLKAVATFHLFRNKDNNNLYVVDDYVAKLDYPVNEKSLTYALGRFQNVYDKYLKDGNGNIFMSIVPDKGYFTAAKHGYPSMDYSELFETVKAGMPYAEYVDITNDLELESYYKTDTHWRQECITDVAKTLKDAMGILSSTEPDYKLVEADDSFYGVYYGQVALPMKAETLNYLTNETLESCVVTSLEDVEVNTIYNLEKMKGKDPYDIFLSGATPLITIENPNAGTDKELIVFRDSFGSSLVPLLADGYAKITVVDIRYMNSDLLGDYVEFGNQDVLFLYSTLLLNSSSTLK